MTIKARVVLLDCDAALTDLRTEPTGHTWRCRWAAAVSLLRAVGHVLKTVDSQASTEMADAIRAAWETLQRTRPEPEIFWQFIEEERNNVLKAYQFGAKETVTISPPTLHLDLKTGEQSSSGGAPTTYHHFMRVPGPFAGQHPTDLVADGIAWWRSYLDNIDTAVAQGDASA